MLPLPIPVRGGSIDALAAFFNIPTRDDFVLVIAWLLASLRCGGPYPILAVSGEQGSTKTVFSKMLRALIDPNVAPVRAAPREERDLFIAAGNSHLLAFDNLSELSAWGSDALCRLASGGSFAVRRLYTDQDEIFFRAARPIVLNGIENVVSRPDLADRAIFLALSHIPEERRRSEREIWREFELARPQILGALIEAATHGLQKLPIIECSNLSGIATPTKAALGRSYQPDWAVTANSIATENFRPDIGDVNAARRDALCWPDALVCSKADRGRRTRSFINLLARTASVTLASWRDGVPP